MVDETQVLPIGEPVVDPTEQADVFDRLAAKREELSSDQRALIPVPGYNDPQLLIEYKLMTGPELNAIGRKVGKETKDAWYRQLHAAIDVMVAAATGVYVQMDGSEPKALTIDGEPCTGYTSSLAQKLRIDAGDPPRVRKVVREIFGNNDVALGNHSFRLQRWMSDTSVNVDEELFEAV